MRLWNEVYRASEARPPDESLEFRLDEGTRVGELARKRYPQGRLIEAKYWDHENAKRHTLAALQDPSVRSLFEAAFEYAGTRVRCDVLAREDGGWSLWEVKSVLDPSDLHVLDLAIQLQVLNNSPAADQLGAIRRCGILSLNRAYVWDGNEYDTQLLFAEHEFTAETEALQSQVMELIAQGTAILALQMPPVVEPGRQCGKPYECPFLGTVCPMHERDELRLLPGIRQSRIEEWHAQGIHRLDQLPFDAPGLNAVQKRALISWRTDEPIVEPGLRDVLAALSYPRCYLDFETITPILPRYANTRPMQMLPFQFSVHIERSNETPAEHCGYLHPEDTDPRRPLAEALLQVLEGVGEAPPILCYTSYEKRVIADLARALPDLADRLASLNARIVDLHSIVKQNVYHPRFEGSFSIKSVLPALVPGLNYNDLDISEGNLASFRYLQMLEAKATGHSDVADAIRQALWDYCKRDTEAMVAVIHTLFALV